MTYRDDNRVPLGIHLPRKATKEGETTDQAPGRKANRRTRHSFYLDADLVHRLDQAYRRVHHELYPVAIGKSDFLEECLRYALSSLQEIKGNLTPNE